MSHYECNDCGHTFTRPCTEYLDHEQLDVCCLCRRTNFSLVGGGLEVLDMWIACYEHDLIHYGRLMKHGEQRICRMLIDYLNNRRLILIQHTQ